MARLNVSMDRLEHDDAPFTARQWESTPKIDVPREFERKLDEISRLAANVICDTADDNFLRRAYFNIMAKNEFDNDDFDRLIRFVCDFIELRIALREVRDIDDELEGSIEHAVLFHTVFQIEKYRELEDELLESRDQKFKKAVAANIARFHDIEASIEEVVYRNNRPSSRDQRGGRSDRVDRGSSRDRDRDDRGRDRYRDRDDRDNRGSRGRDRDRDDRTSRRDREDRGRDRVVTGRQATELSEGSMNTDFDLTNHQWTDRPQQTGRRAVPSSRDVMEAPVSNFERGDFGAVADSTDAETEQLLRERQLSGRCTGVSDVFVGLAGKFPYLKKEDDMDIEKHGAIYATPNAPEEFVKEIDRVMTAAQAVSEDSVNTSAIEGVVQEGESIQIFTNISTMIASISQEATVDDIISSGDNTDGVRRIHHYTAIVDNSFMGYPQLKSYMEGFENVSSLSKLRDYFEMLPKTVGERVSAEAAFATDLRAVVELYDRVITKELNAYCRDVLKISDGDAINSFTASYGKLLKALDTEKTQPLLDAVLAHSSNIFGNIKEALAPKFNVEGRYKEKLGESNNFGMAVMPMSYLVTHLPFTIKELGYKLDTPTAITDTHITPFLNAALDISKLNIGKNPALEMAFRVIITRDGSAFRLYTYPNRNKVKILAPIA